jgi:hypothetical protein
VYQTLFDLEDDPAVGHEMEWVVVTDFADQVVLPAGRAGHGEGDLGGGSIDQLRGVFVRELPAQSLMRTVGHHVLVGDRVQAELVE